MTPTYGQCARMSSPDGELTGHHPIAYDRLQHQDKEQP